MKRNLHDKLSTCCTLKALQPHQINHTIAFFPTSCCQSGAYKRCDKHATTKAISPMETHSYCKARNFRGYKISSFWRFPSNPRKLNVNSILVYHIILCFAARTVKCKEIKLHGNYKSNPKRRTSFENSFFVILFSPTEVIT